MKKTYILIGTLVLLVCIGLFAVFRGAKKSIAPNKVPIPTPISIVNTKIPLPSIRQVAPTIANIFENKTIKKELDLLENRQPLSATDKTTKTNLIELVSPNNGTIYETSEYRVIYIKSLDEFQVEIKTSNAQQAKKNAVTWFALKGMSNDGICKLPLIFFTNYETYQKIKLQNIKDISPLADGC